MCSSRGPSPLSYRRIGRSEIGIVCSLEFEPDQLERFLGPLPDILDAVRRGPAHSLIGVEAAGELVGFYVVHPDPRDRSCWWLGWLAIDRRNQGRGYGRGVMAGVMDRLRRVAGCRRMKLAVAPDNANALRLYAQAGFRRVGVLRGTGELILEAAQATETRLGKPAPVLTAALPIPFMSRRVRRAGVPPAARMHGGFHGPPARLGQLLFAQGDWRSYRYGCLVRHGRHAS